MKTCLLLPTTALLVGIACGSLQASAPEIVSVTKIWDRGDTSYPGMVWHDGLLWIPYYSSHEEKTSIYLARIRIQ
jgi:hypothetical protein